MARRGSEDGKDKKKPDRGAEKKSEKEGEDQEQTTEKKVESEHSRAQNQLGNQALAAMVAAQQGAGGRGGVEVEMAKRKADTEKEGQGFGGDDDGDPPILLEDDLNEAWNPSTTAPGDRAGFLDAMPEGELPPEDEEFLAAIRQVRDIGRLASTVSNEALVQPSAEILAISAQGWARGVARFVGTDLHQRAWARLLKIPGAVLQDPHGRVLIFRARAAALASNALLAGPALVGADVARCAVIDFALELESRDWRVRSGRVALGDNTVRAQARATLAMVIGESDSRVFTRQIEPVAFAALRRSLDALLTMDDPHGLVPQIAAPTSDDDDEPEEDDDPLGLDAVMAEMTGGERDPREAPYRAFLQAADRVATAIYITRVRAAGVAATVADVATLWSAGAPGGSLLDAMGVLDAQTNEIISLLKDVARAANKRTVALHTLRAWLFNAATRLVEAREHVITALAEVIGGILPGDPHLPDIPDDDADDALANAWDDGQPLRALRWMRSLPASLDRDAAIVFTRLAGEYDAAMIVDDLVALRARAEAEGAHALADAVGVGLGAAWMHLGKYREAISLGEARAEAAIRRRNGIVAAEAILLQVEGWLAVGDADRAAAVRLRGGAIIWQLGARGGLTLLARWEPPEAEDDVDPI